MTNKTILEAQALAIIERDKFMVDDAHKGGSWCVPEGTAQAIVRIFLRAQAAAEQPEKEGELQYLRARIASLEANMGDLVSWEYRTHYEENTVQPGWGPWVRVEPRAASTKTVETRVLEFQEYIKQGKPYELRALYAVDPRAPLSAHHPDSGEWQWVPKEPIQALVDAAEREADKPSPWDLWRRIYRAMLAAAPKKG